MIWDIQKFFTARLLPFLIEPSEKIVFVGERQRARLLSLLLFFAMGMVFLSIFQNSVAASFVALAVIGFAYGLSRTRHYQVAALLAVFALMIPSFVIVLTSSSERLTDTIYVALPLSWLLIALILASLWAKTWITALVTVLTIAAVLILPVLRPEINPRGISWTVTLFGVSGGLLILASAFRNRDLREIESQTKTLEAQQHQLQISANRYRELVENVSDIVYTTNTKGILTYVSPSAASLTGYTSDQLIGLHYSQLVEPTWRDTLQNFYVQQFKNPTAETTLVFPLLTAANQIRWVEQKVTPILDKAQTVASFQGIVRDITERKQSEEKLRGLYEIMAQPTLDIDHQLTEALKTGTRILGLEVGIISHIEDETYTVLYGYSPDDSLKAGQVFDFKNTYCEMAYQADDLISIENMGTSAYQNHPCYAAFALESYIGIPLRVNEKRFGTLSFSSRVPREKSFAAPDKDFFSLMGKWVSTTLERKLAESKVQALLEAIPDMLFQLNTEGIFLDFKPAKNLKTLVPPEVFMGKDIRQILPPLGDAAVHAVQKAVESGCEQLFEYSLPEQGELHHFEARITPSGADSALVIVRDVTTLKESQQQIQIQNEALVKTNRELAIARKQAEAANKLKSQFLATMSHELRTPLNAVIGYAQLQLAGMVGDMSDEQFEFQERILANAQHLLQLINEVLDLSKIEAGRMELAEKPFDLRECLDEIILQNKVLAEDKCLAFELLVDDRLPDMIIGDRGRIKQIIINLVSNAIKFTDEGTVTIDAALHNKESWRITVTDSGAGIAPHLQETIFDEFRQAENGIERGGTGLGLAIVRKLVLMMGGNIRLNSEIGRGSAFTITLPLITETQQIAEVAEILEA